MNKGTVKFYNNSKGFGFIKDADSDNEYFVHVSGLKDQIKENDEVTFELAGCNAKVLESLQIYWTVQYLFIFESS